ncbi:ComEA family DNA-binding protein [Lachnoclostridium sp. Marseille-P6806]|uniref:ComEA family DNA-binding protein n=1 Tax=Lachnoclostridium sp. Marseille-P6806 TaxID=2364793 RepID=UPI0013EEF9B2|nr:ComEA family DNA-binding protein [Lachnoclostridium sp. Marseille-P6806]
MKRSRFSRALGLLLVVSALGAGAAACGWSRDEAVLLRQAAETRNLPETEAEGEQALRGENEIAGEAEKIMVFVCGAVRREGVYELPDGARVYEAVKAAGGFSDDAEQSWINQALVLRDADELRVPTREEAEEWRSQGQDSSGSAPDGGSRFPGESDAGRQGVTPGVRSASKEESSAASGDGAGGRINLNTADAAQLMTIPGIGKAKAEAILCYREQNGLFHSVEEVMKIRGIKAGLFEKMKPYIGVE